MKLNKKMLLEIFHIPSLSGYEKKQASWIKDKLDEMNVPYHYDNFGNVWNIDYKERPILSSHMDTVQDDIDAELAGLIKIRGDILSGYGVIGGDDKCGIYIILEMLKKHKNLNFVFSTEEEIGGNGIKGFCKENKKNLLSQKINFGIIIDRKGSGDIICNRNSYGTKSFEKELKKIGKDFKFSPERGSFSDADSLKEFFSCANLSCGYRSPHSKDEFVVLTDLLNALKYVDSIIEKLGDHDKFEPEIKKSYTGYGYTGYGYPGYGYGYEYEYSAWDEYDNGISPVNHDKTNEARCAICEQKEGSFNKLYYLPSISKELCSNCLIGLIEDLEQQDLTIEGIVSETFIF